MPKAPSRSSAAARRHNPLADDILSAGHLRTQSSKKSKHRSRSGEDEENGERFVDAKLSRKILQIGQELAEEDAAEQKSSRATEGKLNSAFDFDSRFEDDERLSEDEDKFADDQWGDEEEIEEVVRISFQRISYTPWCWFQSNF